MRKGRWCFVSVFFKYDSTCAQNSYTGSTWKCVTRTNNGIASQVVMGKGKEARVRDEKNGY